LSFAAGNFANAERLGAGLVDAGHRRGDRRASLRSPATPQDAFGTQSQYPSPEAAKRVTEVPNEDDRERPVPAFWDRPALPICALRSLRRSVRVVPTGSCESAFG
jgi:hypothetical protein